jgi:diguanylate cyclase (GGDEF)-like protein
MGEECMPAAASPRASDFKGPANPSGAILTLLAISGLAILALVFLAAIWASAESDAAALDRQRNLVNERLHDQLQRVSQEMQLIGAGYTSLLAGDPAAVMSGGVDQPERRGVGSVHTFEDIATTVFGYDAAFLVTPSGKLALRSDQETTRRFEWVRPLLEPLFQAVKANQLNNTSAPDAEASQVELMRLEGRPSVAGVTSVSSPLADINHNSHSDQKFYLAVFRFLDGATLDAISRDQGLAGARYARTADPGENEVAFQIEATQTGEPIGFIVWEPDLPGSRVVGRLVPVLSIAGLVIAALFFALMGRLHRTLQELRVSEQHARHLAAHDGLTGLSNRALFTSRLEHHLVALNAGKKLAAVALIDLDRFKEINDTYGHAAGDDLLCAAVDRISSLIKPGDTLARVGGDEFALLLPEVSDADESCAICNNIILELTKPFNLKARDLTVNVGCSIGIIVVTEAGEVSSEVLRRADTALYDAKAKGRGRLIQYSPSLDQRVVERELIKSDLRLVLEHHLFGVRSINAVGLRSAGSLELYYQGIHRGDQQATLCGAEALIRWRHPTLGLLSPDKFIPIAEEAGLIDLLGEWVLRNAARAAASWPAHITLAVNVSPSQIRKPGVADLIFSILSDVGLAPIRLELELTEAALFSIDKEAQATLARLRAAGIKIALDDFGTGFSSLSHVIQLNIDRIKIDQSFVKLLGTKAEGAAVISAILGISHVLGKETTAEGVETESQREFLVAAGCTQLQGFLLSRPIPLAAFVATLRAPVIPNGFRA